MYSVNYTFTHQYLMDLLIITEFLPLLDKFGPKNQSCLLKMKFLTYSNLCMLNYMAMFTFPVLDREYCPSSNLFQKNKTVCLR